MDLDSSLSEEDAESRRRRAEGELKAIGHHARGTSQRHSIVDGAGNNAAEDTI